MNIQALAKKHISKPSEKISSHQEMMLERSVNNSFSNNLTLNLLNKMKLASHWVTDRLPTDEELHEAYLDSGEPLFLVIIDNPNKKHAKSNMRPYIVREAILSFDMATEKYHWLVGSDNALSWNKVNPKGWSSLPSLY